jgi:archaeoflavoprotein AfpA
MVRLSANDVKKKRKVAWGITGSGDKMSETVVVMKRVQKLYGDLVSIDVYLSKAAVAVLGYYRLEDELRRSFRNVMVEADSNSPFLAGWLQTGKYEFLLVAPATSNSVAKISVGIADSLISNSAIMALKGFVPVYVLPSDCREGSVVTTLPDGSRKRLRVRKEDVDNVRRLESIKGVFVLEKARDIGKVFEKHLGS